MLSPKIENLITKARIVSFASWQDAYSQEVLQMLQEADDQKRFLTDRELDAMQSCHKEAVQLLREQAAEIVEESRSSVLSTFPGITEEGGALFPAERAQNCWRDFWHFLRCITYGIAGNRVDFTNKEGFENMQLLYVELLVPLDAMKVGLEKMKDASLQRLSPENAALGIYFDQIIEGMFAD